MGGGGLGIFFGIIDHSFLFARVIRASHMKISIIYSFICLFLPLVDYH